MKKVIIKNYNNLTNINSLGGGSRRFTLAKAFFFDFYFIKNVFF